MKRFAFILGIILIAAVLVAAGFWLGYSQRFMVNAYSVTALDKVLTDASIRARVLSDLDSGDVERARSLLRTMLDGDIMTIWAFGNYSDARSRKIATNLLAAIAADRAAHPTFYTNRTDESEINARIASMLEQARTAQTQ